MKRYVFPDKKSSLAYTAALLVAYMTLYFAFVWAADPFHQSFPKFLVEALTGGLAFAFITGQLARAFGGVLRG